MAATQSRTLIRGARIVSMDDQVGDLSPLQRQLDDALRQVLAEGKPDPAVPALTKAAGAALRAARDELHNTLKIG